MLRLRPTLSPRKVPARTGVHNAPAWDQPKISDFGLARQIDEPGLTRTGVIMGTPWYMAPEQARGQTTLGPAADVWALGAIFYHCLTGNPPFEAKSTHEVLRRVMEEQPAPPNERNQTVPLDPATICLKCLHKEPARRYASATALAEDLARWLAGEPIMARPVGRVERATMWVQRNRLVAALLTVLALAVAGGVAGITWKYLDAENQREMAVARGVELQLENAAKVKALAAETAALEQSRKAEKSATQQRQLSLQTVRRVVYDIHAQLKDRPVHKELRKLLLARALDGLKAVARAADTAAQVDQETIWVHCELGDIFLEIEAGGTTEAKKQYDIAHDLARRIAEADPSSARAQRDLSISYNKLGDVQMQLGDSKAALASYQQSLKIFESLAEADPSSARAQRDLSISYNKLGDVQMQLGDSKAALASYQQSLKIFESLAKADPSSARAQRDLSISYNKLGDVQMRLGDSKAALASYQESLKIHESLAKTDPSSAQAQRDLSVSYEKLGDVQMRLGASKAALASYRESLKIHESLAKADPSSAEAQRDLSVSCDKLGDVHMQLGDSKAALASYQQSLNIRESLAKADPSSAQAQRDPSFSYDKLGDVHLQLGDSKAALASYRQSLNIRESLAKADPSSAQAQRDLLVSNFKLGNLEQQAGQFSKAIDWYVRALDIPKRFPRPDFFKQESAVLESRVCFCRAVVATLTDPTAALKQPEELRPSVLAAVTYALARQNKPERALAVADLLVANAKEPGHLYDAACGYALCVPLADKAETKEKRAVRAVELLRQAVAKGFKDAAHMKRDADLDALRGRDDFKKLLAELEAAARTTKTKEP